MQVNKKEVLNNKIIRLEDSFFGHEKTKYWSPKNELKPENVTKKSGRKIIFDCECGHEIMQTIAHIQEGKWCAYCSNPPKKLCFDTECERCFEKSFASSDKAKYWSNKNNITPREIFKTSNTKYLFECEDCNHEINISPGTLSNGQWCSFCGNKSLCLDCNCKSCFEKSFASCDKAKYWSNKNNITPREIFKSSHNLYLFDCGVCNHELQITLNGVIRGRWCSYCANQLLCSNKECTSCLNKSFASSPKAIFWSNKNKIQPREIFKSSGSKYIFDCNVCGYEYECVLYSIIAGSWCPCVKNKTETKLKNWLINNNFNVNSQVKYDWCKNSETNKYLPFDFAIDTLKIIIELDGPQHFKQVSNWLSPEETINNDIYKMQQAINNGYTIIRLLQEDVLNDKNDWVHKLKMCIEIPNKKPYYFICTNNEYAIHETLLGETINNITIKN